MSRLIKILLLSLLTTTIHANIARRQINVCYYDQEQTNYQVDVPPMIKSRASFLEDSPEENVERGFLLFYQNRLFDLTPMFSCYGGGDCGYWKKSGDEIYSASTFVAYRLWILHLPLIHPYIEYSAMGPTVLSRTKFADHEFSSHFVFQNYLSMGLELGEGLGVNIDVRMVRYTEGNFWKEGSGFRAPTLVSVGLLY